MGDVTTKVIGAVKRGIGAVVEEKFYSPDQERDDNGRWSGGSQEGKAAEGARFTDEHRAAMLYHKDAAKFLGQKGGTVAADAHHEAARAHERAAGNFRGPSASRRASRTAREASATAHERARELSKVPTGTKAAMARSSPSAVPPGGRTNIPKSLTEEPRAPGMKWVEGKGFVTEKKGSSK